MNTLETINTKWDYKADKGDKWRVLDINKDTIEGDCEDYSLTVLYHFVCEGDWKKFLWYILSGKASMWYVEVDTDEPNRGHAVMEVKHYGWIDNWSKEFVLSKEIMINRYDHDFKYKFSRLQTLSKLLAGKVGKVGKVLLYGAATLTLAYIIETLRGIFG